MKELETVSEPHDVIYDIFDKELVVEIITLGLEKKFMNKSKSQRSFENINATKERLQHLSTETIISRLTNFNKSNDVVIAYKQILKDRGINDYFEKVVS